MYPRLLTRYSAEETARAVAPPGSVAGTARPSPVSNGQRIRGRAQAAPFCAPGWERPPSGVGLCGVRPLLVPRAAAAHLSLPRAPGAAPRAGGPGGSVQRARPRGPRPGQCRALPAAAPPRPGGSSPAGRKPWALGSGRAYRPRKRERRCFIAKPFKKRCRSAKCLKSWKLYFYPNDLEGS